MPIKPLVHVARTRPFDGHENTPLGIIACSSRGPPMHMPGPRSLCMYVYVFTQPESGACKKRPGSRYEHPGRQPADRRPGWRGAGCHKQKRPYVALPYGRRSHSFARQLWRRAHTSAPPDTILLRPSATCENTRSPFPSPLKSSPHFSPLSLVFAISFSPFRLLIFSYSFPVSRVHWPGEYACLSPFAPLISM